MDQVPQTETLNSTDLDGTDPYRSDRPGLGWLAPGEQLEPWDFASDDHEPDTAPRQDHPAGPPAAPGRRAEGWIGGSLTLTDDLLRPGFEDDDEPPIPVTAPPADAPGDGRSDGGTWADEDTGPLPTVTPRRRYRGLHAGLLVALVLACTGVVLAVVDYRAGTASPGAARAAARPGDAGPPANQISAPVAGRSEAVFDLLTGVATVNLRTDPLGDELYRIGTPPDSEVLPRAEARGDRIQLSLVPSGKSGAGAVDITLNSQIRWDLRLAGGTKVSVLDLSGGEVGGVELTGGASRIDLTLPRPDGTLTVRMTGGVSEFLVHTAEPVPVRVRVGSGAGQVVLRGRSHNGVAAGELFTPARWEDGGDRIDLDAVAGMSALKVD